MRNSPVGLVGEDEPLAARAAEPVGVRDHDERTALDAPVPDLVRGAAPGWFVAVHPADDHDGGPGVR